ncbi:HlyD family secretion protein [Gemmatimonadota bacterium]
MLNIDPRSRIQSRRHRSSLLLLFILFPFLTGCEEEEPRALWGSGVLEAEEVVVSSVIGGRLLLRPVEEGDRIEVGSLVALIDTTALVEARELARVGLRAITVQRRQAETALAAAREQFDQAVLNRDRVKRLVEGSAATQAQLDELESLVELTGRQVESAETAFDVFPVQVEEIRLRISSIDRQIGECRVTAPRSGTVITVFAEPGEVTAPGRGIARIADLDELHVRVYIPATLIGRVSLGGEAVVRVDSFPERTFPGQVVHIADEAEFTPKNVQTPEARADLVFAVKVAVSNPDGLLKIGLPADVDLPEITP